MLLWICDNAAGDDNSQVSLLAILKDISREMLPTPPSQTILSLSSDVVASYVYACGVLLS